PESETTIIHAPLFVSGREAPLGFLLVRKTAAWTREEEFLLTDVSISLALRLANQQMREQLEQRRLLTTFVDLLGTTPLDASQEHTVRRLARVLGVDLSH